MPWRLRRFRAALLRSACWRWGWSPGVGRTTATARPADGHAGAAHRDARCRRGHRRRAHRPRPPAPALPTTPCRAHGGGDPARQLPEPGAAPGLPRPVRAQRRRHLLRLRHQRQREEHPDGPRRPTWSTGDAATMPCPRCPSGPSWAAPTSGRPKSSRIGDRLRDVLHGARQGVRQAVRRRGDERQARTGSSRTRSDQALVCQSDEGGTIDPAPSATATSSISTSRTTATAATSPPICGSRSWLPTA